MFDMGFTEMMLIGIVALIVIGPERLPGVARTAGKYFGRLKRFMTTVRADVEQELRADELRQILAQQQKELDTIKDSMSDAGKEFEEQAEAVSKVGEEISASLDDTATGTEATAGEGKQETVAAAETVERDNPAAAKGAPAGKAEETSAETASRAPAKKAAGSPAKKASRAKAKMAAGAPAKKAGRAKVKKAGGTPAGRVEKAPAAKAKS